MLMKTNKLIKKGNKMYIRRKVFSLLQDENGEERYFSTTEFTREVAEEKTYAKKDDEESTGKKVAKGAGKTAENAVKETAKKTKDATVEAGKKTGNFIKRAWKGETNGFKVDAKGQVRKNGKFASEKALKKNATKNRALMIGTPVVLAGTGIAAKKIAKNRKNSED